VLTGITRPTDGTHTWLSDPASALPQWVQLDWESPVTLNSVELTFPHQLVLETHWENPFYVAPHVARGYRLEAWVGENWQLLHRETDNSANRRRHVMNRPVTTARLRLLIEQTHLARSAGLAEIRCY
jgi:hypothetical protein